MYTSYFGLTEHPFSLTPDPRFLFMSRRHKEALAHLLYGMSDRGGFLLLTGEVGTGKTTLCRSLLEQVPEGVEIALVLNPKQTALELVASVCDELHVSYEPETSSLKLLIDKLNARLMEIHSKGRRTVLIIDEAQNLSMDVLEQVRLLTNLETTRQKLLQILLIGQPELQVMMARPELRQLGQRITARYHLTPLLRDETAAYIQHRLVIAGCNRPIMKKRVITRIHRLSGGVPRLINTICDRSLLAAYAAHKDSVDRRIVIRAASEVMGGARSYFRRTTGVLTALLILVAVLAVGWKHLLPKFLPGNRVMVMAIQDGPKAPADSFSEKTPGDKGKADVTDRISGPHAGQRGSHAAMPGENVENQEIVLGESEGKPIQSKDFLKSGQVKTDLKSAISSVFQIWRKTFSDKTGKTACELSAEAGLRCYFERGNWTNIMHINRPVILELIRDNIPSQYVAVVGIQGDDVLLGFNGEKIPMKRNQIDQFWFGDFIFLWETPPMGSMLLKKGDTGPDVIWLREQLDRAEGAVLPAERGSLSPVFDDPLKKRVMGFQRLYGIKPDGVVGEQTLIRINTGLGGPSVPVLRKLG